MGKAVCIRIESQSQSDFPDLASSTRKGYRSSSPFWSNGWSAGEGCRISWSCLSSARASGPVGLFRLSCKRSSIFLVRRSPNIASGFWIRFPSLAATTGSCLTTSSSRWPNRGFNPIASSLKRREIRVSLLNRAGVYSLIFAADHPRTTAGFARLLTLS